MEISSLMILFIALNLINILAMGNAFKSFALISSSATLIAQNNILDLQ